jgi:hypothetical protein
LYTITIHNNATKGSTILFEKLRVSLVIKRFLLSMQFKGLLLPLQDGQDIKIEWGEKIRNFGPKMERRDRFG